MTLQDLIKAYAEEHGIKPEEVCAQEPIELQLWCIRDDNYTGEIQHVADIEKYSMQLYIQGDW